MVGIEAFKMALRGIVPSDAPFTSVAIHPKDYFELEAQSVRDNAEHPFKVCSEMGIRLYVTEKAPRIGT
jgi:hypothetical protein